MKRKALVIAGWLVVWQAAALLVHNTILLAGPLETLRALAGMAADGTFWGSLLSSLVRIVCGFLIGSAAGIGLAFLSQHWTLLGDILSPAVRAMKAVPVASFVILLLIWGGSSSLAFWICFLVVFPILYLNTQQGLLALDRQLVEMADVFRIPMKSRIRYIILPGIWPFLRASFEVALGMSWKSGVAAEVIGQPLSSIGNGLYRAKIYLATDEVAAWTIVIILLSWGLEKLFLLLFDHFGRRIGQMSKRATQ